MVNGRPFGRLRLDNPTPSAKYLSPRDSGAQLYVPRHGGPFGKALVVCEGEFKAAKSLRMPASAPSVSAAFVPRARRANLFPAWQKLLANGRRRLSIFWATPIPHSNSISPAKPSNSPRPCRPDALLKLPRIPLSARGNGVDDIAGTPSIANSRPSGRQSRPLPSPYRRKRTRANSLSSCSPKNCRPSKTSRTGRKNIARILSLSLRNSSRCRSMISPQPLRTTWE